MKLKYKQYYENKAADNKKQLTWCGSILGKSVESTLPVSSPIHR